jgi:hypothetical protein
MATKDDFKAGMKVKFKPEYESEHDRICDYTLVKYDLEDGTGRVEDKYGEGWYVYYWQLIPIAQI